MKIRIHDITPEGRDLDFSISLEDLNSRLKELENSNLTKSPKYAFEEAPEINVSAQRHARTINLKGTISSKFITTCVRCLEEARTSTKNNLDVILQPKSENIEIDEKKEDPSYFLYEGDEIDLETIAQELAVLQLPFTVLCSNDCKGLCVCGANLNTDDCSCKKEDDDNSSNPFSILKKLTS